MHHIHSELQVCVSAQGTRALSVGSGHRGPHPSAPGSASHTTLLSPWQAPGPEVTSSTGCTGSMGPQRRWESLSCLEASVMFNLFDLLTQDLHRTCVASEDSRRRSPARLRAPRRVSQRPGLRTRTRIRTWTCTCTRRDSWAKAVPAPSSFRLRFLHRLPPEMSVEFSLNHNRSLASPWPCPPLNSCLALLV
ncbi:hypothetical protein GH733_012487, partial [Mirounga leonina]